MRRIFATGLLAVVGVLMLESTASAQEIQLTGPLAGAPAVRELRWHRNGRLEIAPTVSFTLLDEYKRTIFAGARLQYHVFDWLGVGVWGAYGVVHMNTALTDEIDKVDKYRWDSDRDLEPPETRARTQIDRNASLLSVGQDFPNQLGKIQWIAAPQITAVPFRGKLALFQKIFVDTDIYVFGGPAFIGLEERADYSATDLDPSNPKSVVDANGRKVKPYPMATRMAIAPTFGLGMTFYTGSWTGLSLEYRAIPFAWNASGFDSRGGPPDESGPDFKVDGKDRAFKFNQMISLSFSFFLPTGIKSSP
ncbi:MAG: hypothetical protein MUF54_06735 [Polyangiaceae bacterium]|nr:hypothetical protein [Polyangiaceae bacterium]